MDDLISRQAAIEAIEQMQMPIMRSEFPEEQLVFTGMSEALQAIKDLPSVQPEIVRCKECKWYRKEYGWNCIEYTVCEISPTHHPIRREDDFCSYAERRTDG